MATGGIGFFVLYDLYSLIKQKIIKKKISNLTLHSKVVMIVTSVIYITGTILIYSFEGNKFSESFFENFLYSSFQTVNASATAGFNSVDIAAMSIPSLFTLIILMFIGASPGSTAGGIKTTSFASIILFTKSVLKGNADIFLMKRRLSIKLNNYAIALTVIAVISITIGVLILTITEKYDYLKILFEAVSAFGTVGLSAGITFGLSSVGKIVIILLMFIGRVGALALGLSFISSTPKIEYSYPQEEILIV